MNDSEAVNRYVKIVYLLAQGKVQRKSDVEDIAQEVLLKYVDKQPKFENDRAATKWFSVVMNHTIINHYKKADMRYIADTDEEFYESQPSDQDFLAEVEDIVAHEEQMSQLTPPYGLILMLRFDNGYSIKDIAEHMGESVDRTKTLLMQAKREYRSLVMGNRNREKRNQKRGKGNDDNA